MMMIIILGNYKSVLLHNFAALTSNGFVNKQAPMAAIPPKAKSIIIIFMLFLTLLIFTITYDFM